MSDFRLERARFEQFVDRDGKGKVQFSQGNRVKN